MNVDPSDLRIDTYRPPYSGWSTNDSGVRVTHIPTGISAMCHDTRSQHQNKADAIQDLKEKLKDWKAPDRCRLAFEDWILEDCPEGSESVQYEIWQAAWNAALNQKPIIQHHPV